MSYIVIASANSHKVEEYRELLKDQDVDLHSLADYPGFPGVEENGTSFTENASIKAVAVCKYCDVPAFADDSGLEVDALGGEPGVYSARYSGEHGDDEENNRLLLEKIENAPDRSAHYTCAMALVYPDGRTVEAEGYMYGEITKDPRGERGFGYDPLFVFKGETRTVAEMTDEEKNAISHRANALRILLEQL